jgi:hypothetical protein
MQEQFANQFDLLVIGGGGFLDISHHTAVVSVSSTYTVHHHLYIFQISTQVVMIYIFQDTHSNGNSATVSYSNTSSIYAGS